MHLKMLLAKWQLFCLGFNVLTNWGWGRMAAILQMIFRNAVLKYNEYIFFIKISLYSVPKHPIDNMSSFTTFSFSQNYCADKSRSNIYGLTAQITTNLGVVILVQVMAWHCTGDKPLPETITKFIDIYVSSGLNVLIYPMFMMLIYHIFMLYSMNNLCRFYEPIQTIFFTNIQKKLMPFTRFTS